MKLYNEVKKKLEDHPSFRERRFRGKFLSILALRREGLENKEKLSLEELADFARSFDSYRHEYDRVLKDYVELRGQDYEDKKKYEQLAQMEFGYESGYYQLKK